MIKVTSANKVIIRQEANLFHWELSFSLSHGTIYILCMFNSCHEGLCYGESPRREKKTTFVFTVIVTGVEKEC